MKLFLINIWLILDITWVIIIFFFWISSIIKNWWAWFIMLNEVDEEKVKKKNYMNIYQKYDYYY